MKAIKRVFLIALSAALLAGCAACGQAETHAPTETTTAMTAQHTTQAPMTTEIEITLPNYPDPKVIKLDPNEEYPEEADYKRTYRVIYYLIPYDLAKYVGSEPYEVWVESRTYSGDKEIHEMLIAKLAKDFNIPKEDFVEIYRRDVERHLRNGWSIYNEADEIPNANIIYTFDNEIINAYYRRENPVAPDWSKTATYESYAAYQEANPQ